MARSERPSPAAPALLAAALIGGCVPTLDRAPPGADAAARDAPTRADRALVDGPPLYSDLKLTLDVVPDGPAAQPDARVCPGVCVVTLAGSGTAAHKDGPAAAAAFRFPTDVAVTGGGKQVLVADRLNHRIRRIAAGVVSTFAGSGKPGTADGAAAAAEFYEPTGLTVDAAGAAVYVADRIKESVRAIKGGAVSTVLKGLDDPTDVLLDPTTGGVYVADTDNNRVLLMSAGGGSTVVAGDGKAGFANGSAASARFFHPHALARDAAGTLYVADRYNHCIRAIAGGVVSTAAGQCKYSGYKEGPVAAARFDQPRGVAVDAAGSLYVGDANNHRVRLVKGGTVSTHAGSGKAGHLDGAAATAKFFHPTGLVVDAAGRVYVADEHNHRVRLVLP